MVLVDAEMFTAMYNKDRANHIEEGDEEELKRVREQAFFAARVAAEARHVLVSRFGANLDNLAPRAREAYDSLYTNFIVLERERKKTMDAALKLLDEGKK